MKILTDPENILVKVVYRKIPYQGGFSKGKENYYGLNNIATYT